MTTVDPVSTAYVAVMQGNGYEARYGTGSESSVGVMLKDHDRETDEKMQSLNHSLSIVKGAEQAFIPSAGTVEAKNHIMARQSSDSLTASTPPTHERTATAQGFGRKRTDNDADRGETCLMSTYAKSYSVINKDIYDVAKLSYEKSNDFSHKDLDTAGTVSSDDRCLTEVSDDYEKSQQLRDEGRDDESNIDEGSESVCLNYDINETQVKRVIDTGSNDVGGQGVEQGDLTIGGLDHGCALITYQADSTQGNDQDLMSSLLSSSLCPVGLECLLDTSQLVVHMGNLRHDIFFNVRCERRMEVIDETRRMMFYVEQDPAPSSRHNSFLFRFYDKNKQSVCHLEAVVYSPLGVIAGFVKRVHTCHVQEFHILAPNEVLLLRLRGTPNDMEVYSIDLEHELGRLSVHGWVGVMHEIRRTARDYGLTFPLDLDVRVKTLLLAALFVVDWLYTTDSRPRR